LDETTRGFIVTVCEEDKGRREVLLERISFKLVERATYRFMNCVVVFGVYLYSVDVHFLFVEGGNVKKVPSTDFVMPEMTHPSLVQQEGLFAPGYALGLVVLDLEEERCKHFGIIFWPERRHKPPAHEVAGVHELFPRELFVV
jgi:hypothetical protein